MDASLHCNSCNLDFKSKACLTKHMYTRRHIERSSTDSAVPLFTCLCGRSYSYHQSLYVHHKKCEKYKNSKKSKNKNEIIQTTNSNAALVSIKEKMDIQTTDSNAALVSIKEKMDIYEKESILQNATLETMKQKLNLYHKECNEMKDQITRLKNANNSENYFPFQKTRDKRKKINIHVRQQVAEKQQNTCGECKKELSPHFQLDHVIALQFGGTDEESNLMALCCECHNIKSIGENQCKQKIRAAIETILKENRTIV